MEQERKHAQFKTAQVQDADVQRRDDSQFQSDIEQLLDQAEQTRLSYMQKHRDRGFVSMTGGLISILIGAGGFGWFFLMEYDILKALASMVLAIAPPILLHFWAEAPIKTYIKQYKTSFMPQMARALGGFKFHPSRGISAKILSKTGIVPRHTNYKAEDCFMGVYKGIKVIFSEAWLSGKRGEVFNGIFVLLEIPNNVIEGHTIVTADQEMVKEWASTRWSKLQKIDLKTTPAGNKFQVFSDMPEAAGLLIGERLLKELSEASNIFDNSPLSAVLFRGKYIFMSIPYEKNMFEASSMFFPVTTKQHALSCKKEVEQLLEVIDVFELYKESKSSKDFAT